MKFSSKQDVEAPIEQVFGQLADFDGHTRQALRRGAEVDRVDTLPAPGPGMTWDIGFKLRGKQRQARLTMERFDAPNEMALDMTVKGLEGKFAIELVALSRQRTRMNVEANLKPQTLSARLMIQSLKLARGNLGKRFETRVSDFAKELEKRCASA